MTLNTYLVPCVACGGTRNPDAQPCRCRARPLADEGTTPTLDEVDRYLTTATPEARLEYLDRLLDAAHRGHVCLVADHDRYPDEVDRHRRAWAATLERSDRWRRLATHPRPVRPLP